MWLGTYVHFQGGSFPISVKIRLFSMFELNNLTAVKLCLTLIRDDK